MHYAYHLYDNYVSRTEFEAHCHFTPVRTCVGACVGGCICHSFISGTTEWIFLKFYMVLEIKKSKTSTEPDFS